MVRVAKRCLKTCPVLKEVWVSHRLGDALWSGAKRVPNYPL